MKKVIILLIISIFLFSCASIPTGPEGFNENEIGAVHLDAESLAYEKASYLYMGVGENNFLMLSEINHENYQDAFGVKQGMGNGIYDKYLKINPGIHDLTITSIPQGLSTGNTSTITTIDLTYEFISGHIYIYDQKENGKIDVLYWKLGSKDTYKDEIKLKEKRD